MERSTPPPTPATGPPRDRAAIAALIPHQGAMCLLERVLAWDAHGITAVTTTHRDPAHPLRSATGLRALHLCEYGAQAAALHGALLARAAGVAAPARLLAALRDVQLGRPYVDDLPGELVIRAGLLLADGGGGQYAFEVRHRDAVIAAGRLAVMRGADPG